MVREAKKNVISLGVLMLIVMACQPEIPATPASDQSAALTLTSLIQTLDALTATTTLEPAATLPAGTVTTESTSATFPAGEFFPTATDLPSDTPTAPMPPTVPPPTVATIAAPNNPAPAPSVAPLPQVPQVGWIEGSVQFVNAAGFIMLPPHPPVEVILHPGGTIVKTDSNGKYVFTNVPVGEALLTFKGSSNFIIDDTFIVLVRAGQPTVADTAVANEDVPAPVGPTSCQTFLCDQFLTQPPAQR